MEVRLMSSEEKGLASTAQSDEVATVGPWVGSTGERKPGKRNESASLTERERGLVQLRLTKRKWP